jgi:hypothetical protein
VGDGIGVGQGTRTNWPSVPITVSRPLGGTPPAYSCVMSTGKTTGSVVEDAALPLVLSVSQDDQGVELRSDRRNNGVPLISVEVITCGAGAGVFVVDSMIECVHMCARSVV